MCNTKNSNPQSISGVLAMLLEEFSDVFDATKLKPMMGEPMDILLQDDVTPSCAYSARPISYAFRDQMKSQIDYMVANGIVEPISEPSDWCHPIDIVNKKALQKNV